MKYCKKCGLDQQCCFHQHPGLKKAKDKARREGKKESNSKEGCDCASCSHPYVTKKQRSVEQKFMTDVLTTISDSQILELASAKISAEIKPVVNKAIQALKGGRII